MLEWEDRRGEGNKVVRKEERKGNRVGRKIKKIRSQAVGLEPNQRTVEKRKS